MGFGLHLVGRVKNAQWIENAQRFLTTREDVDASGVTQVDEGKNALAIDAHSAAQTILLVAEDPTTVSVSALTSTAGPGYHAFVCTLLTELGHAIGIEWLPADASQDTGDVTGYFFDRDDAKLNAFAAQWLQTTAQRVLELVDEGGLNISLSLPAGITYEHEGVIATPMGPRNRQWLIATARDGHAGFDAFPWPRPGLDADYYLGRALNAMWLDMRWRTPANDDERGQIKRVLNWLERAYHLDGKLEYPWREWAELQAFVGDQSLLATRTQMRAMSATGPMVGYRRRDVRIRASGPWSLAIPGSFAENWDEKGTWSAWDKTRSVWLTTFSVTASDGSMSSLQDALHGFAPLTGDVVEEQAEGLLRRAMHAHAQDDQGELHQLRAYVSCPGQVAVITINYENAEDRPWALAVWRSLIVESAP